MGPEGRTVKDYNELIAAFIERRHELGFSQGEVDYLSGLQEGYTGKVESWEHRTSGRGLGILTLPRLMRALGVVLVVVPIWDARLETVAPKRAKPLPREQHWLRVKPVPKLRKRAKRPARQQPSKPVPRVGTS